MTKPTYYAQNKEKINLKAKENYQLKKDEYAKRAWKNYLWRTYSLSEEDYEEILVSQDYACKICSRSLEERRTTRRLVHIDHDHKTGRIRGILCSYCNKGIGCFLDSPSLLRAAAAYLEE